MAMTVSPPATADGNSAKRSMVANGAPAPGRSAEGTPVEEAPGVDVIGRLVLFVGGGSAGTGASGEPPERRL